jgi:hypothetical protein
LRQKLRDRLRVGTLIRHEILRGKYQIIDQDRRARADQLLQA